MDAILFFKAFYLFCDAFSVGVCFGFPPYQQHILRRVLHLDEFHHLGLVAEILQNQGANGVSNHHRLTCEEDAIPRDGIHLARAFHLLSDLLVTTRGTYNQFRTRLDTRSYGIVGSRVAGVKRYQHIQLIGMVGLDTALHKLQAF